MFDIGWTELLVIGIVALIVVGPKDLPKLFRSLGQFTAKARNMAREFQRAMDAAADETGVKEMARDMRDTVSGKNMGLDELRDIASGKDMGLEELRDIAKGKPFDPDRPAAAKSTTGDKAAHTPDSAAEAAADEADAADAPARPAPKKGPGPATRALAEKRAAESRARTEAAVEAASRKTTTKAAARGARKAQADKEHSGKDAGAAAPAQDERKPEA